MPSLESPPQILKVKVKPARYRGRRTTEAEKAEAKAMWQWSKGIAEATTKVGDVFCLLLLSFVS